MQRNLLALFMPLLKKFFLSIIFLIISSSVFSQTGPGGVGSSTNNKLWLRSDAGVTKSDGSDAANGDLVATWRDTSGNGNHFTQGTSGSRPSFTTSIALNGKPQIDFQSKHLFKSSFSGFNSVTGATWFIVLNSDAISGNQLALSAQASSSTGLRVQLYDAGGGSYRWFTGSYNSYAAYGANTVTADQTYLLTSIQNGSTLSMWRDGNSETLTSYGGTLQSNTGNISSVYLGTGYDGSTAPFSGQIAEVIMYNEALNTAQRTIVENYLAAKYGRTIANDRYQYEGSYPNDVAGIGYEDATNQHTSATSAGILNISNAASLNAAGDYLLFGHDNQGIGAWTTSEVPAGGNRQRLAREWRFDQNGSGVGAVSISIDTTLLPAKPSEYTEYVIWLDADGDFTNNATQYPLHLNGNVYTADNVSITDGDRLAIGVIRPVAQFNFTTGNDFENAGTVKVPLNLNYSIGRDVIINYTVQTSRGSGYATHGPYPFPGTPSLSDTTDFYLVDGSVTIAAGTITDSISIPLYDDIKLESDETFTITLSSADRAVLGTNTTLIYTIQDDDSPRRIYFSTASSSINENTEDTVLVTVKINLINSSTTSANYSISGTATGGGVDHNLANGTVSIPAGEDSAVIRLPIIYETLYENNETVIITLSNPVGCNLGTPNPYTHTIVNDDTPPTIQFTSSVSTISENTTPAHLSVSLSNASGFNVTANYAVTANGSATGGEVDYRLDAGTVTIPAGSVSAFIDVIINNDQVQEGDETVVVKLTSPSGATLGSRDTTTLFINDDDNLGHAGPGGVGDSTSNRLWLRADVGALNSSGSSAANGDNIATWRDTSGNGNHLTQTTSSQRPSLQTNALNGKPRINFDGSNDRLFNSSFRNMNNVGGATMFLVLSTNNSATNQLAVSAGTSTSVPSLRAQVQSNWIAGTYNNFYQTGDAVSSGTNYIYSYEYNGASLSQGLWINGVTNTLNTGSGGSPAATSGNVTQFSIGDAFGGTLVPWNGSLSEAIVYTQVLNSVQRLLVENYLSSKYGLSIGSNDRYAYDATHGNDVAGIGFENSSNHHSSGQSGNILGIRSASSLNVAGDYMLFGSDNGGIATWTTSESPNSGVNTYRLSREWRFSETGEVGTVSVYLDTALLPSRPLGYTTHVIWVDSDGDFRTGTTQYPMYRNGSSFSADAVTINDGDYVAIGVIQPLINFVATASNGEEAGGLVTVKAVLNHPLAENVTVDYSITGGTASGSGVDYTLAQNGTLTFVAGNDTAMFDITINADPQVESDETIVIELTSPSNGISLGSNTTYTYTINDDDAARRIGFMTPNAKQDESQNPGAITVGIVSGTVSTDNDTYIHYEITGTSTKGVDHNLDSGTVVIPANNSTANLPAITVNDDGTDEDDETIIITLSNPINANIAVAQSVYRDTIVDNDNPPSIEFASATASGNESVASPAGIKLHLSLRSGKNISVNYAVDATSTATSSDYNATSTGTITVNAGDSVVTFDPQIVDDAVAEITEQMVIIITGPTNATLGNQDTLIYSILDNDNNGFAGPGGVGDASSNRLWLRADAGVTKSDGSDASNNDAIVTWRDTSGNNNHLSQSTSNYQPTLVTNSLNGKPQVSFDGSNDRLFNNAFSGIANTSGTTTFLVMNSSVTTGNHLALSTAAGSTATLRMQLNGSWIVGANNNFTENGPTIGGTGAYLLSHTHDGSVPAQYLWINSASASLNSSSGTLASTTGSIDKVSLGDAAIGAPSVAWNGRIAEVIIYDRPLGVAQRTIIENYLAAKYGLSISSDHYAYESSYGNEVAGIGYEGSGDFHTAAQSSKILKISGASDLTTAGEYLLFGHNGQAINTWSVTNAPTGIQRLAREWVVDITGSIGSVTVTVDTAQFPARASDDMMYAILVDADGDFTSGASFYPLAYKSGSLFESASQIAFNDGDHVAIGVFSVATIASGSFNDPSIWSTGTVPGSGIHAIISNGHSVSLGAHQTVGSLKISTGATLSMGNDTLTLDQGSLSVYGTFNAQTGVVEYAASGSQTVASLTYHHLTLTNGNTKTLAGDISTNGNLVIDANTTLNTANYNMTVAGNFVNNGVFTAGSGTITFNGTTTISGTSTTTFNNLVIASTKTLVAPSLFNVAGNFTNNGTFTHSNGTVKFTGTTTLSGSSINFNHVTINGILNGSSGFAINVAGNWNNGGTFNHNTCKVTFNGSSTQTITRGGKTETFYKLTVTNPSGVFLDNSPVSDQTNVTVIDTLSIGSNCFLAINDRTLTVGDSTGNGTGGYFAGSGGLRGSVSSSLNVFGSGNADTLRFASNPNLLNFNVSKKHDANGQVRLGSSLTIGTSSNGSFRFYNGKIVTGNYILRLEAGVAQSYLNTADSIFISGILQQVYPSNVTNAVRRFLVGKGNMGRSVQIYGNTGSTAPVIETEVFEQTPPKNLSVENLVRISTARYWRVRLAGGNAFSSNMRFEVIIPNFPSEGIGDTSTIVIGRLRIADSTWTNAGGFCSLTQSLARSLATTLESLGNNTYFVLASTSTDNTLPVELSRFEAMPSEGKIMLNWKTESEVENAYWLVQKAEMAGPVSDPATVSLDSLTFTTIKTVRGQGTKSSATDYAYIDEQVHLDKSYVYRLADVAYNGTITYHQPVMARIEMPKTFGLDQNYPNPFNPVTTIKYRLPVASKVTLKVYNILGQHVKTLVNGVVDAGYQHIQWQGDNEQGSRVSSGMYLYRLDIQALNGHKKFTQTRKMALLK